MVKKGKKTTHTTPQDKADRSINPNNNNQHVGASPPHFRVFLPCSGRRADPREKDRRRALEKWLHDSTSARRSSTTVINLLGNLLSNLTYITTNYSGTYHPTSSMSAEDNEFFAVPPSGDAPPAAGEEPIILGEAPPADFATPPAEEPFLGDVTEPPAADDVIGLPPPVVTDNGEPTPMQKWNEEWQETLKARKEEETARKAELVEAAKLDLETFQQERAVKREAKLAKNREDEQAKLEAIEADLENDNSWQRVCKMIELSHDSTAKSADVKRMRDVLILLKNEPTRAEALTN